MDKGEKGDETREVFAGEWGRYCRKRVEGDDGVGVGDDDDDDVAQLESQVIVYARTETIRKRKSRETKKTKTSRVAQSSAETRVISFSPLFPLTYPS